MEVASAVFVVLDVIDDVEIVHLDGGAGREYQGILALFPVGERDEVLEERFVYINVVPSVGNIHFRPETGPARE